MKIVKTQIIVAVAVMFFCFSCHTETTKEIEGRIAKSPKLLRLDALCSTLPKFKGIELRYKMINGNSDISMLTFYYSKNIPYKDVLSIYSEWFNQNGWHQNVELASSRYGNYSKDNYQIAVSSNNAGSLEIGCMEPN